MRIALLTSLAMFAFAGNSVLARVALTDRAMDPASYTMVRILSGALLLAFLAGQRGAGVRALVSGYGNWLSAAALFCYAATFSFAYVILDAGVGAVILFASVQATMIGWGLLQGDRPGPIEWAGVAVAFGAFVWLVSPGLTAPDPPGVALMIAAGIAWGAYSLRGRTASDPLNATASNFLRCVPAAILLVIIFAQKLELAWFSLAMAVLSGAVASGVGYAIWYSALPGLTSLQASTVQLTVPVIASVAGDLLLDEALTMRLLVSATLILGGVAATMFAKNWRKEKG